MISRFEKEGCLVTGAAGFVGSHLAERLLTMGCWVVGVDNFFSGKPENMASFRSHPRFEFHQADINDAGLLSRLKDLYPQLNYCFHLAAIVSVPYSMEHSEETMETNYRAVMRILDDSDRLGFNAFIFAGSAAEYGDDQRLPLREHYPTESTAHLSPYGRAKFLASRETVARPHGISLRFFNIYGPRQDPGSPYSGVISRFIEMARAGVGLTVFGDGRQSRDFIHVSDVVDAYVRAAGLDGGTRVDSGVYNIGSGMSTAVLDLAHTVRRICGGRSDVIFLPERPGDIRHSLAAVDKFRERAQWRAGVSLEDGLRHTIAQC